MTDITNFQFKTASVRVVTVDGEPWFVAKDVAAVLGYADTNNAVKQHCRGVVKHHPIVDSLGRSQQARIIAESDMLRLIVNSKLPAATQFERWVFEEVLPAIRRTGFYAVSEAEPKYQLPATFAEALRELADAVEEKQALEARVAADAPKVLFADSVATSQTTILVGDLAKILRGNGIMIGANRLFAQLREDGYLIKRQGTDWNMPTQRAMELELFKVKETAVTHSDGHVTVSKTPKVTGKGQSYFINRYSLKESA